MEHNGKWKIVCVSDHFMKEEFYLDCLKQFPDIELISIPYFGSHDRIEMRSMVDRLEKEGAYAFPPPPEVYEAIRDADLIMVHLCPIPRSLMEAAPKLKYILTNRGGLENIDMEAAHELGIPVLNNPAHNGNAVAELTVCLMVAETRNVARAHVAMKNGQWRENWPNTGRVFELRGKTVGIVGFGTIGRMVAEKLQPFRVKLLATDPNVTPDDPDLAKYNVKLTTPEEVMSRSDIVTIHARTAKKEQIIGKAELDLMKPTATLINTARAYLLDYDYLAEMLREERITGAALEVFPEEPLPKDSPFISLDNVTLTNHRGGDTVNCYSDSPEYLLTVLDELLKTGKRPKFYIE
ncbi:MAG: 2-hydroxyacid dehydrogenase [Clostridia bacterium]|nr:2-hydroxyacid dehydrogenase [Clostridia bacterium]